MECGKCVLWFSSRRAESQHTTPVKQSDVDMDTEEPSAYDTIPGDEEHDSTYVYT